MAYLLVGLIATIDLVFAVSAYSKLRGTAAQRAFAASLRPLGLLPNRLLAPVAALVTGAEVVAVGALTWALVVLVLGGDGWPIGPLALILVTALVGVLTTGVALAVRRGTTATCACFGATERPLSVHHLIRNGLLSLLAVGGLIVQIGTSAGPAEPVGCLLAVFAGAVAALVLIRLDDLVEVFASPAISRRS